MRKSERLLHIVQILRRNRRPVTADKLANELHVSVRTIYRDIGALIDSSVPIQGEAGIGYVLGEGYDLPPMMLTVDEIEALHVGMRWVEQRGDHKMAAAARDVLAKVAVILPRHLKPVLIDATLGAPQFTERTPAEQIDVSIVRCAIRERYRIQLDYTDETGAVSERIIWPLAIGYFETSRVLVAWCELRAGFRHFRTDRMQRIAVLGERYRGSRAALLALWRREQDGRRRPKAA